MLDNIDFSMTPIISWALLFGAGLPIYLVAIAHLPRLKGRNALQFAFASLIMLCLYAGFIVAWARESKPDLSDVCAGLLLLGAGSVSYLEVWSLLSRGYTLGLLVTLLRSGRPLNEAELAQAYRGGDGLVWIMRHRVSGLMGAGLIRKQDGWVTLTPRLGLLVASLYRFSVRVLGLRRTG